MQTCWFIVIEVNGQWHVDCEGKSYGPFRHKEEALSEGTRLARTFGDPRRQTQLWVKDESGARPRQVWAGPEPRASMLFRPLASAAE
jgi:hypothetical protein